MIRLIPAVVFLCISSGLYAQHRADSLKKALVLASTDSVKAACLDQLAFTYSRINPDSGLIYAQQALDLYTRMGSEKGIAAANSDLAINHAALGNNTLAIHYHTRSLEQYRKLGKKKSEAAVNFNISTVYEKQGDYPNALIYAHSALEISEELGDSATTSFIWESIGTIYFRQNDYDQAMENHQKALAIERRLGNPHRVAHIMGNIGLVHDASGRYEQALTCYDSALESNRTIGDKYGEQVNLMNIGLVFYHMKNFSQALVFQAEALEISRTSRRQGDVAVNLGNIGDTYYQIAMDSTAQGMDRQTALQLSIGYLSQAVELCKKVNYIDPLVEFMSVLSKAYAAQGDYRQALTISSEMTLLKDSMLNQERKIQLKDIEARRDLMLADKELQLRDKQLLIAALTAENRKHERILLITGIGLMALLITVIVVRYRSNARLHKNRLREIAFLQSHELRGPVARMMGLVQLLRRERLDERTEVIAGYIYDVSLEVDEVVRKAAAITATHDAGKPDWRFRLNSILNPFRKRIDNW